MKIIDIRNKRGSSKDLALEPKERSRLYFELKDIKDRIIFLLGCYCGLRATEIAQMRFSWISYSYFSNNKILCIQIPIEDRDARNKHKKFKQKQKWKTGIYIFDSEVANEIYYWYLNNKDGLLISRQAIHKRVVKHFYKIIDRKISVHALRATFANYITQELRFPNGEKPDPLFVKTQLRHKDLRTTMNHYKSETKANQEAYLAGVLR